MDSQAFSGRIIQTCAGLVAGNCIYMGDSGPECGLEHFRKRQHVVRKHLRAGGRGESPGASTSHTGSSSSALETNAVSEPFKETCSWPSLSSLTISRALFNGAVLAVISWQFFLLPFIFHGIVGCYLAIHFVATDPIDECPHFFFYGWYSFGILGGKLRDDQLY